MADEEKQGILHREEMEPVGIVEESENKFDPTPDYDREGVLHRDEMEAKTEVEGGIHDTSTSIGKVVSDRAQDAAGNTPDDLPQLGGEGEGVLGKEGEDTVGVRQSKRSGSREKADQETREKATKTTKPKPTTEQSNK